MNKFLSASKLYLSQVVKIEEPISTGWKVCAGFIALILYEIYLYTWRQVVQPYPDFMYLEFYQIFLDYLAISSHSGNDFFEILGKLRAESFPGGFFVFPWFIALLGIQNIFLEDPWKINFFLTVPMALIPTVMDWDRKRTLAFLALFFFFPATQIILKSWNIQSMIAIYLICAFTCYWSNLKEPSLYKIVLFTFFAWISITIKHMGVLYLAMIFPILLVWRFLRKESVSRSSKSWRDMNIRKGITWRASKQPLLICQYMFLDCGEECQAFNTIFPT